MRKLLATLTGLCFLLASTVLLTAPASATECVPSDAWTETVEHPEVSHEETTVVVDQEAYTEVIPGVAEVWANFSPNKEHRPFDGPPTFPEDERGTWHVHEQIPGGHVGPDGVYQKGEGHGSWFYRQAGVEEQVIEHEAVTHEETVTVVDEEAWTEVIEHEAVVCEEEPEEEEPTEEPCPDDSRDENCEPVENPRTDVCPNLPGDQITLPYKWTTDAQGNCVPLPEPPVDVEDPTEVCEVDNGCKKCTDKDGGHFVCEENEPPVKDKPKAEKPEPKVVTSVATPVQKSQPATAQVLPNTGAGDYVPALLAAILTLLAGALMIRRSVKN